MCQGTGIYWEGGKCYCPRSLYHHPTQYAWPSELTPIWERQRTDNRQGKPRRIALIRDVWHLSCDSELVSQIHTIWHDQRSIAHAVWHNQRFNTHDITGSGTAQESLSLID